MLSYKILRYLNVNNRKDCHPELVEGWRLGLLTMIPFDL